MKFLYSIRFLELALGSSLLFIIFNQTLEGSAQLI